MGISSGDTFDLKDWWVNQDETDTEANLLIAKATKWGEGGAADIPGTGAVATVYAGFDELTGPGTDPDLIGDNPATGYSATMQMSTIIHEIAHMTNARHKDGYSNFDNSQFINFVTPMITGYRGEFLSNNCNDSLTSDAIAQTIYTEALSYCADNKGRFNINTKIFSKSKIDNL